MTCNSNNYPNTVTTQSDKIHSMYTHVHFPQTMRTSQDNNERSRKDRQMTLMILVSTLTYTILSLPPNINQMLSSIIDSYNTGKQEHYLFAVIRSGVNVSQTLG